MSIAVLVFNLDDTLFDETDYIRSGLRIVAEYLSERFNWSEDDLNRQLVQSLAVSRDEIIQRVLTQKGAYSEDLIKECTQIFNQHIPNIRLSHQTKRLLKKLSTEYSLYVVSNGQLIQQKQKLSVLGLSDSPVITASYLARELGKDYILPSAKCFDLILEKESCRPENLVYIADNPEVDFLALKPRGYRTIRVLTGAHANVKCDVTHEAEFQIEALIDIEKILSRLS